MNTNTWFMIMWYNKHELVMFIPLDLSCHFCVNLVKLLILKYSNATFVLSARIPESILKMSLSNWVILSFFFMFVFECMMSVRYGLQMFVSRNHFFRKGALRKKSTQRCAWDTHPSLTCAVFDKWNYFQTSFHLSLKDQAWVLYSLSSFSGFFMFAVL